MISHEEPLSCLNDFPMSDWEKRLILTLRNPLHATTHFSPPTNCDFQRIMNIVFSEARNHLSAFADSPGSMIIRLRELLDTVAVDGPLELSELIFPGRRAIAKAVLPGELQGWLDVRLLDVFRSFVDAALTKWAFRRYLGSSWSFSTYLHKDVNEFLVKGEHDLANGFL